MILPSTAENNKAIKLIYLSLCTFSIVCMGLEKKDLHFKSNRTRKNLYTLNVIQMKKKKQQKLYQKH